MADADSLHDMSSDQDQDPSAVEADAEDDDQTSGESPESGSRKKSKKKKRKNRDIERSSGDSDSQAVNDETVNRLPVLDPQGDRTPSGMEADSEGQYSQDTSKIPDGNEEDKSLSLAGLQKIQKAVEFLSLQQQTTPKTIEEAKKKKYQFWDTQPVPKINEKITGNEEIEADRSVEEIRQTEYSLPDGFQWDTLDLSNPLVLKELYTLLNENYVEDDDNMFRFDYSPEFLLWALQPPGWHRDWHCGVRATKSKKLVGFISAIPANIKIYDRSKHMVEINFLCVHKKLRSKRVAPVLIREITRRVHLKGLFQAVYTAGVVLPKPVACCRLYCALSEHHRALEPAMYQHIIHSPLSTLFPADLMIVVFSRYWHRSLNPRKLIEVKFSHLSRNMTMQRTLKLYKLNETTRSSGFRVLTPADVKDTFKIVAKYLDKFELSPVFSEEEFKHWFLPRQGIVDSFVVERNGDITDFVSFYTLPSTVMHHPVHKSLKAAYSFYNVATSMSATDLMQDALIIAKNMGFDVFNALDLMDNKEFLEKLKFGVGDGNLQYYLYNWKCPSMEPHQADLVNLLGIGLTDSKDQSHQSQVGLVLQ